MNPPELPLISEEMNDYLDNLLGVEAAEKYLKRISSKDKELKWYPDMFHALYIDKDREKVFIDIVNWLEKHI